MKNVIKGLIIFLTVILISLIGFTIYGINRSDRGSFGFNFFENADLVSEEHFPVDSIETLSIDVSDHDIHFVESTEDQITVRYYATKRLRNSKIITNQNDSTLSITGETLTNNLGFSIFGNHYRYLEVAVPQSFANNLKVEASSGNITTKINFSLKDAAISTSSGEILLNDLNADNISLTSSSGTIKAGQLKGKQTLKTSSGEIFIKSVIGDSKMNSSSGTISINDLDGNTDLETSSGEIIVKSAITSGRFHSSSGTITVHFEEITGALDFQTTSGEVTCRLPQDSSFNFSADTTSGDIHTFFDDALSFDRDQHHAEGKIGSDAENTFTVKTTSGSILLSGK